MGRNESRTGERNSAVVKIYRTNSGMQTKLENSAASTQLPRRGTLGTGNPAPPCTPFQATRGLPEHRRRGSMMTLRHKTFVGPTVYTQGATLNENREAIRARAEGFVNA